MTGQTQQLPTARNLYETAVFDNVTRMVMSRPWSKMTLCQRPPKPAALQEYIATFKHRLEFAKDRTMPREERNDG